MAFYPVATAVHTQTQEHSEESMYKALHSKSQFTFATECATDLGIEAAVLLHFIEELWTAQRFTTATSADSGNVSADASTWLAWLPFFSPARFMVALEILEMRQLVLVEQQGERISVQSPKAVQHDDNRLEEDVAPPMPVSSPPPPAPAPSSNPRSQVDYDTTNPARLLNQTGDALWATAPATDDAAAPAPSSAGKSNGQSRKRCRIDTQWQPSAPCAEMVKARGIEWEFAMAQREGFVLYYMDSGQMSTSWDSKFLDWVNRRWQYHLNDRQNGTQTNTVSGPRAGEHTSERAPRERKQQLRQRLRDIGDLDW